MEIDLKSELPKRLKKAREKRKLTIDIDCNEKTCGKCKLVVRASMGTACGLYVKVLEGVKNDYKRLPECIAACKEQKA